MWNAWCVHVEMDRIFMHTCAKNTLDHFLSHSFKSVSLTEFTVLTSLTG